jgi:hypothetical protein
MLIRATISTVCLLASVSNGADVLIVSAGSATTDDALVVALNASGHSVAIGPRYWEFDASFDLSPFDVVYIQGNGNWTQSDMPVDAQAMILEFAQAGGGIIFSEWVVWMVQARNVFQVLGAAMPAEPNTAFRATSTVTMTANTPGPFIANGLPNSFTMPLTSFSGTETFLRPKPNATVFYDSDWEVGGETGAAVLGWDVCGGRVVNFSTTNGPAQIADPNFQLLLSNLVTWVTRSLEDNSCPADIAAPCGGTLNFFDITQYLSRYSALDPRADLNGDGVFNFFDVSLYLQSYNQGCS